MTTNSDVIFSIRVILIVKGISAILRLKRIDMDQAIRRLGSDIFIQRIPCDSLDIVVVFGDMSNKLT